MKNGLKKFLCLFAVLPAVLLAGCSCGGAIRGKRFDLYGYFGTVASVAVYADYTNIEENNKISAAMKEIEDALAALDGAIGSAETSDIQRFNAANAGERLEISAETYGLLGTARKIYEETDGAYNPAVGGLVDLWEFSPRFYETDSAVTMPYDRAEKWSALPSQAYVDAFCSLTAFGDVTTEKEDGRYYVTKPSATATVDGDDTVYSMTLDLGGIGKGRAADLADGILAARGIDLSYVSVGSSSLRLRSAYGRETWNVELAHPRRDGAYLTVDAANVAASTGGDYEHAYLIDGKRYCHIIDPFTGAPIDNGMVTVSLFGRTAAESDALTTALAVMGRDKAVAFVNERLTDCRVCIVWYNEETDGYELLTNMNGGYTLEAEDISLKSSAENGRIVYVG